jgi:hypothetical protein
MIPSVPFDQPPIGWAAWLREIARAVNLLASNANDPPAGTGGGGTITLSGDVTGSGTSAITASVVGLQSRPVSTTAPTGSQVLQWSGSAWAPATLAGGGGGTVTSVAAGTGLTASPSPITASGTMSLVVPVTIANGGTSATNSTAALSNLGGAPILNPGLLGTATAPTNAASPAPGSNSNIIATTAFVTNAVTTGIAGIPAPGISQLTGDVTAGPGSGSQAATIASSAVTYAKIQNVAASRLLGNPTGSAAAPGEITLGANLTFAGSVLNAASGGSGTINGVTAGPGLAGGGTTGTVTLSTSVPPITKTSNYTVTTADLGGTLVLGGVTLILTLPAGIFTPGARLGVSVVSSGAWSVTNSTGLTFAGLTTNSLQPGTSGTFIANNDGTTLNFVPGVQSPSTTVLGGVKALAPVANNFLTGITALSGAVTAAQPTIGNLANIAATTLVGNPTGSAAAPSALTLGTNLSFAGTVLNATGSVGSVGLSVPAASILSVTGSPVTGSGTIALATTGTSGGIPYFSSGTALSSSAALGASRLTMGGGAGVAPADSSVGITSTYVLTTGYGATTTACGIELGGARTGNGDAFVDLHSTSGADFELRLSRLSGANGAASLQNTGTGTMQVYSPSGVQVAGTNTNDSAAAGYVGEYVTATAGATALTSTVSAQVTSIALTAGDWDVEGTVLFLAAGTTVVTALTVGLATATVTFGSQGTFGRTDMYGISMTGLNISMFTGRVRISLAAPGTAYLNVLAAFTTSTMTKQGQIQARRVR